MTRETTPLITRLDQAGIPLNEHDTVAPSEAPWFVRLLQAFSGWLAALFLLGFIGLGAMSVVESSTASMGLGLAMIVAAFALLRVARSDVLEHLALAVSLVGQLLVAWAWAWVMVWEASAYLWWPLLALQVVLALVMPSYVHRACSAFAASLALYMALAMCALEQSASGLVLLVLTLLWLSEFRWPGRIGNVQAWGYGLLVSLLVLQGVAHSGQPLLIQFEDHSIGTWGWLSPWLNTFLLALTLALLLHRVFKTQSLHWSAFAGVAALLLISPYVPMVVQGVVVMLLGFAIGHRLLFGLGVLSLLVGMGSYYYWLDTTLLIKALTLLVIGVLLLLLRWVLRKSLRVLHGSSTPREPRS